MAVPKLTAAPGSNSEDRVVSMPSSVSSWSVVSGHDWDQRMLFEALQQNQGVVMDQLLQASGMNSTSGPMALEDEVDIPDDFDVAEAMSLAPPAEEQEEEEETPVLDQDFRAQSPLPPEAPPSLPERPPQAGNCQHQRVTTKRVKPVLSRARVPRLQTSSLKDAQGAEGQGCSEGRSPPES